MAVGKSEYLIEVKLVGGGKVEVTMNGVASSLKQVDKEMKNVAKSSNAASNATDNLGKKNVDLMNKSGLAGATLVELGRTISDLPYGIRGIANNLSQLSTLFVTLITTAGGFKNAILVLKNTLTKGPLGFILIFQAVISALDFFSQKSQKAKESVEDLTLSVREQVIVQNDLADALSKVNLNTLEKEGITSELVKTEKKLKDILKDQTLNEEERSKKIKDYLALREKEEELNDELKKSRKNLLEADLSLEESEKNRDVNLQNLLNRLNKYSDEELKLSDIRGKSLDDLKALSKELTGNIGDYKQMNEVIGPLIGEAKTAQKKYNDELGSHIQLLSKVNLLDQEKARLMEGALPLIDLTTAKTLEQSEVSKRAFEDFAEIARMQEELDGLSFTEEGGVEDFEFALSEFDEFLSKFVTKKEKYDEIAEQAALDRADELTFELDGFVNIEQEKDRIREFFASKREQAGRRETNQLIKEINARTKIQMAYVNTLSSFAGLLDQLGEQSKAAKIAAIIAEQAAGIGSIIINTAAANAKAVAAFPVQLGQPFVTLNKISAALGIAASVLAARNAIKGIKSGQASSASPPSGGGGAAPAIQAPDFNVVGATAQSQLAETVAGTQSRPLRAFVVGKDITTQQELDRNTRRTASFGG